jgi:COP9 signalosome complex subunit 3
MLLVLDAFHRFNIRHLEDTYSTLSVHDICQRDFIALDTTSQDQPSIPRAHTNEAVMEQYILGMIERGELSATLSHPPQTEKQRSMAMVHFLPGSHGISEAEQLQKVEEQIARTVAVTEQIKNLDRKLGLSKEYIAWVQKNKKTSQQLGSSLGPLGPKQDGGDDLESMDIGWEAGIMDEDMMEDFES